MKACFITLGCKVNIYESNALKEELINNGIEVIDELISDADIFIINTCSVTNQADAKSRKMIRKCIKLNPMAIICALGCYVQTNDDAKLIDGVDILIGNGNKKKAVEKILEFKKNNKKERYVDILDILHEDKYEPLGLTSYDHTRAFVKIEDGCQNFCTFCIIPFARGPVRCKDSDSVIDELNIITKKGYSEVVLSGIHTGRYFDKEKNLNFTGLVKRILNEVSDLKRLRISSIEINEIDDEFISLMKKYDILADHLHLPLQSGSDKILKLMERRYDTNYFKDKINKIRSVRPNISISTDIIVGFPYEEDINFMETYNLAKELELSKIHVFPYSRRKGTKASLFPQIKDDIKKKRTEELINLSKKLEYDYAKKFIGNNYDLIIEQKLNDKYMVGHTTNFLQVILPLDEKLIKKTVNVKIIDIIDEKIIGMIEK